MNVVTTRPDNIVVVFQCNNVTDVLIVEMNEIAVFNDISALHLSDLFVLQFGLC